MPELHFSATEISSVYSQTASSTVMAQLIKTQTLHPVEHTIPPKFLDLGTFVPEDLICCLFEKVILILKLAYIM